jgi:sensor domain CHASE-containing protein
MTLRSKILLVTGIMCATLILIAAVIIARLSLSSYARLERQIVTSDMQRLDKALEGSAEQLVVAGRGYAYWDDTQEFIWGTYPEYPVDNSLDSNIFLEIDIDLLIFADIQGNIFYDRFFSDNEAHALDEATLQDLRPLLARDPSDKSEYSGFIFGDSK